MHETSQQAFRVSRSEVESTVASANWKQLPLGTISVDAIDVRFDALSCNGWGNKRNCEPMMI